MMRHQSQFIHYFAAESNKANPEPERLALYIAGVAYPNLDVDVYIGSSEPNGVLRGRRIANG